MTTENKTDEIAAWIVILFAVVGMSVSLVWLVYSWLEYSDRQNEKLTWRIRCEIERAEYLENVPTSTNGYNVWPGWKDCSQIK